MDYLDVKFLAADSLGWLASLLASLTWSFSVLTYRKHGVGQSATWLNLFKGFIALACFGVTALIVGGGPDVPSRVFWTLAISGIIGVFIGDSAFFAALIRIGGTMTSVMQSLAPSLTAFFAWFFLGETLSLPQVFGLILTSACLALLVVKQSPKIRGAGNASVKSANDGYFLGIIYALIAAVCQAVGAVVAKPVIGGISAVTSSSLRLWAPVLLLFGWQIYKSRGIHHTLRSLVVGRHILPLAIGSFAGTFVGLILMMYGMAHAPLGVVLALTSTYPVWIMLVEQFSGRSEIGKSGLFLVFGSVAGIWLMV